MITLNHLDLELEFMSENPRELLEPFHILRQTKFDIDNTECFLICFKLFKEGYFWREGTSYNVTADGILFNYSGGYE